MSEPTLRELCDEARQAVVSEQYARAIEIGRHILRFFPQHIETYVMLGEACLERGDLREATELFQRALSADPEQVRAWVGLASAYEHDELLDLTIWHIERAFELEPANAGIRLELQNLYGRRHNIKELRIKLNAAALGRIYLRGGLYHQAISELRSVVGQEPERHFARVALALAYWHVGQRVEASSICLDLLEQLPNCLPAHLILGEIWSAGDRPEEGQEHLRMAEALDPENRKAEEMFGYASPLKLRQPTLPPVGQLPPETLVPAMPALPAPAGLALAATSPVPDELAAAPDVVPTWLRGGAPAAITEPAAPAISAAEPAAAQPAEAEEPGWVAAEAAAAAGAEAAPAEAPGWQALATELPPELRALVEETIAEQAPPAGAPAEAAPAAELTVEPETELPEWLRVEAEETVEEEAVASVGVAPIAEPESADWQALAAELPPELRALVEESVAEQGAPAPTLAAPAPAVEPESAIPDWLRGETEEGVEEKASAPAAKAPIAEPESADWQALAAELPPELRALVEESMAEQAPPAAAVEESVVEQAPPAAVAEAASVAPTESAEALPTWLGEAQPEELPTPSGEAPALTTQEPAPAEPEEVPDWLRSLAEETRPPEAAATPAVSPEAELPAWLATLIEPQPPVAAEVAGEAEPAAEEALPGWLDELRQSALAGKPAEAPAMAEATPAEEAVAEAVSASMLEELVAGMEAPAGPAEAAATEPAAAVPAAAPTPEPEPTVAVVEAAGPAEAAPGAEAPAPVAAELPRGAPTSPFIGQAIERLRVRPDDHEMRLTLARAFRDAGQLETAAEHYDHLVQSDQHVDLVVADLERVMPEHISDHRLWTLLGDAYMKQGRLSDALSAYRSALGR